ncbi:DUF305 domain-containing protein [Planktothrix mougeotii]|uniref:DUF305 domain-containing protein n=1 Tax=Planktothrix mougeotii LEGE 06226 TaxID=1828728 RepID=A0ABR9U8C9_9CYAN|nr:DUF305 domain-containing protein [Planktothrix mougeotii]MBE9142384.1 DUF305 domain-containing protein [Planktothrix mougeotii LEGE 06226]
MNRKSIFSSLMIGLLAGGTVTTLALVLAFKTFAQASQASPIPAASTRLSQAVPGMGGMMGQPDQHFIVMMIPHHQGAITMADLALQRSQHPEIRTLAQSIKDSQTREIEKMATWYRQWYNADVPQGIPGMGMHGNWGGYNPGTVSSGWQASMGCMGGMRTMLGNTTALQNASDFDRAFIEEMVPHHQMGVRMAQMVLVHSNRPEIRELAQAIIDSQTAEINQMQQWYQNWY